MLQRKIVDKIKTHILYSVTFFPRKSYRLCDNVEKHCTAGKATDDKMAHAHCTLDAYGHKYTHAGCVILFAFTLQQWLHERVSVLRYTYIACLIFLENSRGLEIHRH